MVWIGFVKNASLISEGDEAKKCNLSVVLWKYPRQARLNVGESVKRRCLIDIPNLVERVLFASPRSRWWVKPAYEVVKILDIPYLP